MVRTSSRNSSPSPCRSLSYQPRAVSTSVAAFGRKRYLFTGIEPGPEQRLPPRRGPSDLRPRAHRACDPTLPVDLALEGRTADLCPESPTAARGDRVARPRSTVRCPVLPWP